MTETPKVLSLQPVVVDRQSEYLLQTVCGARGAFDVDAPDLGALVQAEVRQRYLRVYQREPGKHELEHPAAQDRQAAVARARTFRHRGYVFGRIGNLLVGVSQAAMTALKIGAAPLGRAAYTALVHAIHMSQTALRLGQGEECVIDLDVLRRTYDPAGANPNAERDIRDALTVLAGTTICWRDEELGSTTFTPVLKTCRFQDDSRDVVIALNEHFMGCVSRITEAGTRLNGKELRAALDGRTYFHDSGTRLLVSNLPPAYSPTQRRLQSHLFSEMSRRTDQPGTKLIRKGSVAQWLVRLGYQGGSSQNRLHRFLQDLQRVVVRDAGGGVEPTTAYLSTLATQQALETRLSITLPANFALTQYPKLIEAKSGLMVTGAGIGRDAVAEVRAVMAAGITGSDLRAYRVQLGLTQTEVAHAAGIGLRTLIRIENVSRSIKYERLIRVWKALGRAYLVKRNVPLSSEVQSECATYFRNCV